MSAPASSSMRTTLSLPCSKLPTSGQYSRLHRPSSVSAPASSSMRTTLSLTVQQAADITGSIAVFIGRVLVGARPPAACERLQRDRSSDAEHQGSIAVLVSVKFLSAPASSSMRTTLSLPLQSCRASGQYSRSSSAEFLSAPASSSMRTTST